MGYFPEAVFNFLGNLGWNAGDDKEIYTRHEAAALFDLARVTRKPAVFDMDKLNFINQEHLKMLDPEVRLSLVEPFWKEAGLPVDAFERRYLRDALTLMGGRGQTIKELASYASYFLSYDIVRERYDGKDVTEEQKTLLKAFFSELLSCAPWETEQLEAFTREWANAKAIKIKELAMPLRMALTGAKVSPGIFEVAALMGKDEVRRRLAGYDFL